MVSDGDCAFRSVTRTASFHPLAGNAEVTYWESRRYRRPRLALSSLRYPLFSFEPTEGW